MYFDSRRTTNSSSDEKNRSDDSLQGIPGETTRISIQSLNSFNNNSDDGFMTFKLYENVKSRSVSVRQNVNINLSLGFSAMKSCVISNTRILGGLFLGFFGLQSLSTTIKL